MSNAPSVRITITIEPRGKSDLQKAQSPSEPPGLGPIYRGPIRTVPGLHPYEPTKWRDGVFVLGFTIGEEGWQRWQT